MKGYSKLSTGFSQRRLAARIVGAMRLGTWPGQLARRAPRAFDELALHFEFGEMRFVVGVGD